MRRSLQSARDVTDLDFRVPVSCTGNANAFGANCLANTSADALIAGAAKEGKRAVVSSFRIRANDAGPNGTRGDGDDTLFVQQGLFSP